MSILNFIPYPTPKIILVQTCRSFMIGSNHSFRNQRRVNGPNRRQAVAYRKENFFDRLATIYMDKGGS